MYLRTWIYIAEICLEGRVSQNFDLGLSFCFMVCRRRDFEKDYKLEIRRFSARNWPIMQWIVYGY